MKKYVILIMGYFFLSLQGAYAQSPAGRSVGPPPYWEAAINGPDKWPSPQAACKAQHDYWNPNAIEKPMRYDGSDVAECDWEPGENSNTILPAWVFARCEEGWQLRSSLTCVSLNYDNEILAHCECDEGASSPSSPAKPEVGNPVALNSGAKVERIIDYQSAEARFKVERKYYSLPNDPSVGMISPIPGFGER